LATLGPADQKGNLQTELETAETIIHGLAQYSEIDVKTNTEEKSPEQRHFRIDKDLLGLCINRCFRPDLMMNDIYKFIKLYNGD
jgi:hypothetical protein